MTPDNRSAPLAERLSRVRAGLDAAASSAGRNAAAVRLIAVSKTHPAAAIAAAHAAGQQRFGENTVQEALPKIDALAGLDLEWHFIGHLQSNKAKFIPGNFSWVHSLDSMPLAARLARAAESKACVIQALIEVNITRDPRKHGVVTEDVMQFVEELLTAQLPALALRGLMAMGPHPADEAQSRAAFAAVRELRDTCQAQFGIKEFTELSMGMSGDYIAAIREGATLVRIGTALFGEREYP